MDNKKTNLKILAVSVIVSAVLGYAAYFLFAGISSAENIYTAKIRELIALEKKQEQIDQIAKSLADTEKNREEIIASLLSQGKVLDFIVKIEGIAKSAGLAYEVRISKEITQEAIDEELLAIRKSRRRGGDIDDSAIKEKLPGVVFAIELSGTYTGIIRFLEGVASFPYYSRVESFSISKSAKQAGDEASGSNLQAVIQLMVFTKK